MQKNQDSVSPILNFHQIGLFESNSLIDFLEMFGYFLLRLLPVLFPDTCETLPVIGVAQRL
jgi:hypothetical protein